jgi:hypothetical protein
MSNREDAYISYSAEDLLLATDAMKMASIAGEVKRVDVKVGDAGW